MLKIDQRRGDEFKGIPGAPFPVMPGSIPGAANCPTLTRCTEATCFDRSCHVGHSTRCDAMNVPFSIPEGHRYQWQPRLPPFGEMVAVVLLGFAAYGAADLLLRILSGVLPG
jgi:hypothetical protein